jgi:hypothetical protein
LSMEPPEIQEESMDWDLTGAAGNGSSLKT